MPIALPTTRSIEDVALDDEVQERLDHPIHNRTDITAPTKAICGQNRHLIRRELASISVDKFAIFLYLMLSCATPTHHEAPSEAPYPNGLKL